MIERLQISYLRNLNQVNLSATACNVTIGANGSGKTSLLEAIFLLSRGKSFRHHQPKRYIQHHQNAATVHAKLSDGCSLAIQKQADATTILRLNQSTVYNQSILTEQLP
ncbi:MAG: DNA replication and repair protein RecF, partial [Psychrobacter glacincola]